jgi:hypothetical protein
MIGCMNTIIKELIKAKCAVGEHLIETLLDEKKLAGKH